MRVFPSFWFWRGALGCRVIRPSTELHATLSKGLGKYAFSWAASHQSAFFMKCPCSGPDWGPLCMGGHVWICYDHFSNSDHIQNVYRGRVRPNSGIRVYPTLPLSGRYSPGLQPTPTLATAYPRTPSPLAKNTVKILKAPVLDGSRNQVVAQLHQGAVHPWNAGQARACPGTSSLPFGRLHLRSPAFRRATARCRGTPASRMPGGSDRPGTLSLQRAPRRWRAPS